MRNNAKLPDHADPDWKDKFNGTASKLQYTLLAHLGAVTCFLRGTPSSGSLALQMTRPVRAL